MKKLLLIIGLIACMGANALQLKSIGMKHVSVPSGISKDYCQENGDKTNGCWRQGDKVRPDLWDFSDKFKSSVPTLNFSHTEQRLLDENTVARVHMDISTGHYSEVLTVSPSIQPRLEMVHELAEDMYVLLNIGLPTIGSIKEKKRTNLNGDFSYATSKEYKGGTKFKKSNKTRIEFNWKFHAPWGSKEFNND